MAAPAPAIAHDIDPTDFQQVTLARGKVELGEPMAIAVLPDRSVLHTARDGTLRRTNADGATRTIGTVPVYQHDEEGLQGVGVDPGFATNRYIYLYYVPPLSTSTRDAPNDGTDWSAWQGVNRLSRFKLDADFTLNTASKVDVLDVPADRGICCHVGGDIDFDAAGNLYLSTGDDTNPFDSASYSPIDERTNRNPAYDAQRSSANTNDLRGKVLRIKVQPNGTYTIPAGNLFAPGTAKTRPEIYAMGFRNPFRMSVDKATGIVYLGDYGPDAGTTQSDRGPSGQVEFNRITSPGNYGWPYCTGTNTTTETYNEWTFPDGPSGAKYNCASGPTNNSFRNTGLTTLPPARPAWIRYAGDAGSPPEFGTGSESPMGGPVYHFDAGLNSPTKFPAELDNHFFAGEFGRGWIKPIHVNADGSPGEITDFPWVGKQVMDMAFGPDGALYVLDYGTGVPDDPDSGLYRFDYLAGANRAPSAVAAADVTSGQAPLTVHFSSAGSSDPDGDPITYSWDFGDGTTSSQANPTKTYTRNDTYDITLTVTDSEGAKGTAGVQVGVGNTAPTITFRTPLNGQMGSFGDTVPFAFDVTDPEDGSINCARAKLTYILWHDNHPHQISTKDGCSGEIAIPTDGEHDAAANIWPVFDAQYTDQGGLISHKQIRLQPAHRQGEHFSTKSGVDLFNKVEAEGGRTVGNIENGDWIAFEQYNLTGISSFKARVSSGGLGGTLQFRTGSATGPVIGSATVPVTGSFETFTDVTGQIRNAPAGTTTLYLTFSGNNGGFLYDVDSFTFSADPLAAAADVLVFSKTAGFRHDSIPAGVAAIQQLGAQNGINVTATEDANVFTAAGLAPYEAVVFLSTTGDVLNANQQAAFEAYIRAGHGYAGIHAAADTEYDWPFYGNLVGAYFLQHPATQQANVRVEDRSNPATAHLPQTWTRTDEWYDYRTNPRGTAHILATLDESSYSGGTMGADHPIAWCKTYEGGRSFYTGGGHTQESYADAAFRTHLLGGIKYAAGLVEANCSPQTGPIVGLADKCLDVAGGRDADGTKVQLFTCNGTPAQTWTRNGTSFRALGKCLDVAGGRVTDGIKVQLFRCNNTGAQDWVPQADGSIVNTKSGKCLDVSENNPADGQQVWIWGCHGGDNQRWRIG